jgi:transposase InsO family protein
VSYVNIAGTFYYLSSVLDGYSRFLVHWEIREHSKEQEIEIVLQRAQEKFPGVRPRIRRSLPNATANLKPLANAENENAKPHETRTRAILATA